MTAAFETVMRYKTEYERDPETYSIWAHLPSGERIRLRPLQSSAADLRAGDIAALTEWRNRHRRYFLTDFAATEPQTRRWLTEMAGPDPSRILFMIETDGGTPFGHAGLCNLRPQAAYAELDNIVRGGDAPRGAMRAAVAALCDWAVDRLDVRHLWVRVMADNPAVGFYERLGFRRAHDVALEFKQNGTSGAWLERAGQTTPAERYLRYMERAA